MHSKRLPTRPSRPHWIAPVPHEDGQFFLGQHVLYLARLSLMHLARPGHFFRSACSVPGQAYLAMLSLMYLARFRYLVSFPCVCYKW